MLRCQLIPERTYDILRTFVIFIQVCISVLKCVSFGFQDKFSMHMGQDCSFSDQFKNSEETCNPERKMCDGTKAASNFCRDHVPFRHMTNEASGTFGNWSCCWIRLELPRAALWVLTRFRNCSWESCWIQIGILDCPNDLAFLAPFFDLLMLHESEFVV